MNQRLAVKAIAAALLMPGMVTIAIPYSILPRSRFIEWPQLSAATAISSITWLAGLIILLHCIGGFASRGKGTLAPIDPPKKLVVHGLYRHTRNPMYTAVLLMLLSEALFFGSVSLLAYAVITFLFFYLFILFYEEPRLRSRFGRSYELYLKAVPRWGIAIRGFDPGDRSDK